MKGRMTDQQGSGDTPDAELMRAMARRLLRRGEELSALGAISLARAERLEFEGPAAEELVEGARERRRRAEHLERDLQEVARLLERTAERVEDEAAETAALRTVTGT
jgi:hypothetical protein